MIIKKYNVILSRLTAADIELVREKRNSPDIREQMIYQKHIDSKAQLKWFNSIDNMYNLYMLIEVDGEKIGLINGKNSDFKKKESEGGIFLWSKNYHNTIIPALASVIMLDYNFLICEFEKSYIKILNTNKKAINFNRLLGYEFEKAHTKSGYSTFVLSKHKYLSKIDNFRRSIINITNDATELSLHNFSFSNVSDYDLNRLYGKAPNYLKQKINMVLMKENRKILE